MDCVAPQAPLFIGFSRQEYCPALQADSLPFEPTGKPQISETLPRNDDNQKYYHPFPKHPLGSSIALLRTRALK